MQGFVWVIFFIKAKQTFCYPALLTVDGWFHFSALKDSENHILGDPGADSGDEGKSKRAEKYGTKEK